MDAAKVALLEQGLVRAAEVVGDLREPTFARYYARFPGAREEFVRLGLGQTDHLEAMMIDNCLYCIMTFPESPVEVQIVLLGSIPHHAGTLDVSALHYTGLLDAMLDVLVETVPAGAGDELALWAEIRSGLHAMIDKSAAPAGRRVAR